jgi:hypothetical protein
MAKLREMSAEDWRYARQRARLIVRGAPTASPKAIQTILKAEGYDIDYSSVRQWVGREQKKIKKEAEKSHVVTDVPKPPGWPGTGTKAPKVVHIRSPRVKAIDRAEAEPEKGEVKMGEYVGPAKFSPPVPMQDSGETVWADVFRVAPNQEELRTVAARGLLMRLRGLEIENFELHRQVNDWKSTAEELAEERKTEGTVYDLVLADLEGKFAVRLDDMKKLITACVPMSELQVEILAGIAEGEITDDANLDTIKSKAAHRLYKLGFITATPVEGSDAALLALAINDLGRLFLKAVS